jgi:hypothetical protein
MVKLRINITTLTTVLMLAYEIIDLVVGGALRVEGWKALPRHES